MENVSLYAYVKQMRKQYDLTQVDLSEKAAVGLRVLFVNSNRANKFYVWIKLIRY